MRKSYVRRAVEERNCQIIQQGFDELGDDLTQLVIKYGIEDMPLLVAGIYNILPQMERSLGEEGRAVVDVLRKQSICICFEFPEE